MAEVLIKGVRKTYGGAVAAIKGIDAAVADGELMVLLGPSGCGKSTLLRMVAGLEEITSGDIAIAGRVVNRLEPKDRNVAMVFQNYALYPHMSVFDNMAYGLRIAGLKRAEIEVRVTATAAMLELDGLLQRKPRQLSGGQRQRVAMGRAIVREPAVFLFDEPLSNLDAKLRTQMRVEIKRLQRRLGVTSLYVTHDQVEAMTLADRIMVMNAGLAEQIGTPMEIYRRPATLFVAGFVGAPAMNVLPGRIAAEGSVVAIDGAPLLPLPAPRPDEAGRPVTVGIRPEHLALTPATEGGAGATVELVEALGADTLVHARLATGAVLVVRLADGRTVPEGAAVNLAAPLDALHLFDKDSGRRID